MDAESLRDALVESASEVYQYISDMQYATDPPLGVSVTRVSRCDVSGGYAVLHLDGPVPDDIGLMLMVGQRIVPGQEAGFDRYDEVSRTVVVRPGAEALRMMSDGEEVRLLTDMKFIVAAVGEFYRRYGDRLTLPLSNPVSADPEFPDGTEPSDRQVSAVGNVLGHRMSYVWGAPGTGKTQFVLATCIRACARAGRRVAVFAPTNNSVEQVLRGILKALPEDDPLVKSAIRLGVPTRSFLREYPWMCEDRQAQRRLEACVRTADCLDEVMFERCCDVLEWEIEDLLRRAEALPEDDHGRVMIADHPDIKEEFLELSPLLNSRPNTRELVESVGDSDFRQVMTMIVSELYGRERPAADLDEYADWTDGDIIAGMLEAESEIRALRETDTSSRLEEAMLVAATPHQFISRFRPKGAPEDGRLELDVDHIFIDEAGYCGLVQAAALFTNGVPVTFLGDHMQLPPVSQLDDELLSASARRGGRLRYGFLWNLPSLYCEQLLTDGVAVLSEAYLREDGPRLSMTSRSDLTESHRFGSNLAAVLDRFVYRNGMTGSPDGGDLEMLCIDAVCTRREGRDNRAEAEAIRDFLKKESPDPSSVAILTPYAVQLSIVKRMVGRRYRDSAMTVHGSQGREWDTVVLSVADNGIASRDVPLRFTGSDTPIGLRVINTAVSRAKRRLVLVCDREFWMSRDDELIGGILREVPPEGVENFNRLCRGRA